MPNRYKISRLSKMIGFVWLIEMFFMLVYGLLIAYTIFTENTTGILILGLLVVILTLIYYPIKLYYALKFLRGVE